VDRQDPDGELWPFRAALAAPAPRDKVGDAVVGPQLVRQRLEVDRLAMMTLPDVAVDRHMQSGGDRAGKGADLGPASGLVAVD
jgi:hypothetical protein